MEIPITLKIDLYNLNLLIYFLENTSVPKINLSEYIKAKSILLHVMPYLYKKAENMQKKPQNKQKGTLSFTHYQAVTITELYFNTPPMIPHPHDTTNTPPRYHEIYIFNLSQTIGKLDQQIKSIPALFLNC